MADVDINESEEALLLRHKKERKELQSKVVGLKKSCAKGDKKKKKEVGEEIAALELHLDTRQASELKQFEKCAAENLAVRVEELDLTESCEQEKNPAGLKSEPKISKAQKRREKKATKDKEREIQISEQEELNKFGPRNIEEVKIKQLLSQRKLRLHEVPSDGNCLYFAIAHQLSQKGEGASVPALRKITAEYLRENESDLRPFTTCPNTGEELTEEQYSQYCDRTENNSSEWGGQLELQALSAALKKPIEVLQAEGPPVILGEQFKPIPSITLTYHRHAFGLGEHYNSVAAALQE